MSDDRRPLGAARPIAAGFVLPGRERSAIRLRASERIVLIGIVAAAINDVAPLGQRCLLGEMVVPVQLVAIPGDDGAFGVLPGAAAYAVARVDGRLPIGRLSAEIRMPTAITGSRRLGELLAVPIRAFETAEIRALSEAGAGHKKAQLALLRLRAAAIERQQCRDC